jgi:hypothetical protein
LSYQLINLMPLRQRLENLPVGQKLLAALLVLTTVLLVANLTFISAAYWISQESMAPRPCRPLVDWCPTRAWWPMP